MKYLISLQKAISKLSATALFLALANLGTAYPQQAKPLTIDVHAHIFNGEDVPLDGFIEEIALHISDGNPAKKTLKLLVKPLTAHIKLWADGHRQENKKLNKLLTKGEHPIPAPLTIKSKNPTKDYDITPQSKKVAKDFATTLETKKVPGKTKQKTKKYRASPGDLLKSASWARRFTAPRLTNMNKILKTHGKKGKVDIFVTALVDLDYWLKGKTKTHIEDQILINSKLAIISKGRILPFVGFDPYRNVVEKGKALELVKAAILEYGFVGVKLYPPMGFKALGNKTSDYAAIKKNAIWRKPHWGVPPLSDAELATGIEKSLNQLYAWAQANEVPIMAHANNSNYSRTAFKEYASPDSWQAVLTKYPRLKVNLGHFGGIDSFTGNKKKWAQKIITMMNTHPNLYADIGNFKLRKSDGFFTYLEELKSQISKNPQLGQRLMYGSDWFMNAARTYSSSYPVKLKKALKHKGVSKAFANRFMGMNATGFLGLKNGKTRSRLNAFYKKYKVDAQWIKRL